MPNNHARGADREAALEQAEDALVVALGLYVDEGQALPAPSAADGRPLVPVPVRVAAKFALY